jgi:putative transcriptional regulator
MDKQHFDNLIAGVKEMKAHMSGAVVEGVRISRLNPAAGSKQPKSTDLKISQIRQTAKLTQTQFAALIGVNVRTLQNWEQARTKPTGSARALLKIVAYDPKIALAALHA